MRLGGAARNCHHVFRSRTQSSRRDRSLPDGSAPFNVEVPSAEREHQNLAHRFTDDTAPDWDHHAEKTLGQPGRTTLHRMCPRGGKAFDTPRIELTSDVRPEPTRGLGKESPDRGY